MKSGEKTATFSLATTAKWRRKDGGTGEGTEWHRIVVFGAAVEAVEKLVRKGAELCPKVGDGAIRRRVWLS